jgi:hypothetical protein
MVNVTVNVTLVFKCFNITTNLVRKIQVERRSFNMKQMKLLLPFVIPVCNNIKYHL